MYNYYVIEIQTNADGTSGNFVFGFAGKAESEDKFLALRQAANQSSVMIHTVVWMDNKGNQIDKKAYIHPVEVPPEPAEEEQ